MVTYFNAAKNPGIGGLESTCFSYMQQIQNRAWTASHQLSTHSIEVKEDAKNEYERLVSIIESLLKTKIGRSIDDDLTIFGKPIADAGLSDGQKILIQLAAALHAQKASLRNSIFILDEPENHLHPSALIEFLDALSQIAENSQFWISTHSVPLLAHIAQTEPASIWYVEDGIVSNAGTNPLKVLKGLLGDDNQIDALNNFTSLPAQFALINHAVECLLPPAVAENRSGDPQVAQINQVLNATSGGAKMAVLDFGSGKSRLISGLHELAIAQSLDITNSVEYFAFDPLPYDNEIGKGVISDIYKDNSQRHFSTLEEFFSIKDEASIDVVVMCNVLHEINPNEWLTTFNAQSLIGRALKDTGHVLIVEDQRIPNGEKAHQFGFLVLDTSHIKTLFKIVEKDISEGKFKSTDFREDGRLKAHLISKDLLSRIDANSRTKAITELVTTAKAHIKNCRESAPSYKTGQLHGFWTQQFANACLYLDQQ